MIRKASAKATKIQRCVASAEVGASVSAAIENVVAPSVPRVITPVATAAASMSSEPTSV